MSALGDLLQERRQEHRWSLEEVAQRTRIRREYVEALEEGNYAALPADVHVRGFLRNYALVLGLPVQEVLDIYQREQGEADLVSIAPLVTPPRSRALALPSLGFVIFATLAMAVCAFWVYYGWLKPVAPLPTATLPVPTPTDLLPTSTPTVQIVLFPTETPLQVVAPTPGTYEGLTAVFQVSADCWVLVESDGRRAFEGILRAGTTRTFTATQELSARLGNAGGVRVTLNGQDLGVQGRPGQVLNQLWRAEP